MNYQKGFSLIEIILSFFLFSLIIVALGTIYFNIKRNIIYTQSILDQYLDLQLTMNLMRNSVKNSGFTPCGNLENLETVNLEGKKLNSLNLEHGTHKSIYTTRMSERFHPILKKINAKQFLSNAKICKNKIILIADCFHAEVQTVQRAEKIKEKRFILTLAKPLVFTYSPPIYWGEWIEEEFYIHKNKMNEQSLFYKNKHHSEELTTMISNLIATKAANLIKITLTIKNLQDVALLIKIRNTN